MIHQDKKGYVIHQDLDKDQAIMFKHFLVQEQARHQEDIEKIQDTVDYLNEKFNLESG